MLAALGRAFGSLQDAQCRGLLGPVVPGAVMRQGARVPGTSFELDPVVAAFNLGVMMGAVPLASILPVADYLARTAHNEARPPLRMRDVFAAMQAAQQLGSRDGVTAAVGHLLGGSREQVAAALQLEPATTEPPVGRCAAGAAASRAVRLALIAVKLPAQTLAMPQARRRPPPACNALGGEDFAGSVSTLFPARQAALICARLADEAVVAAMPVHEFVALLVKNG